MQRWLVGTKTLSAKGTHAETFVFDGPTYTIGYGFRSESMDRAV